MSPVAAPVAAVLGAAFGLGLVLLVRGTRRRPPAAPSSGGRVRRVPLPRTWSGPRLMAAAVSGVLVAAVTGWPVAGVLTAAGVVTLPDLLGPDRRVAQQVARREAVATWTEMLRDTLSAAAGLEQAVMATADIAPPDIREETQALAGRLRAGCPLPKALEHFAQEVADPAADTVVTALDMAARRQAAQLAPLLGSLAEAVREQVAMSLRVTAGRTSVRTSVRVCCATTLGLAAGLVVFNRPYLEPFAAPAGQLTLAAVGALFAGSFWWLTALAQVREQPRLLAPQPDATEPATTSREVSRP